MKHLNGHILGNKCYLVTAFTGLLMILSVTLSLAQHPNADKPAVHGMLIFGRHSIYASHLPMFHSPHHYQVILELELLKKDKAKFIEEQEKHPENATYTIAPVRFVLPELLQNSQAFHAVLYRGHFERGGTPISDSIPISIKRIIYFSPLPHDVASNQNRYILIGNEKEQFAVHQIAFAPDFDHIIQIRSAEKKYPITVTTARAKDELPNLNGNWETLHEIDENRPVSIQWLRQLYLEFDDLKKPDDDH
ncbi:MAG: hypothetical protein KF846_07755 [Cyclobacteriaceae bacterium]|nr:hypothetical protein [Cyclobacteriaceae bacterium]